MNPSTVALVTGANKGIGFEIVRQLGEQNIEVLLGARDPERGNAAALTLRNEGLNVDFFHLDLEDPATINSAAERIQSAYGRLDILVNNAGILNDRGLMPSELTEAALRQNFEINFFGPWLLTSALLPLLKQAEHPRIVNQSSILGSLTSIGKMDGWITPGYTAAKTALNAMTVLFAKELKHGKVNSAHPGYVETDMTGPDAPLTPAQGAATAVWLATLEADGPTGGFFNEKKPLAW
ncbi:FabG Dehydrogenases with different specificities (related to short-chain alcohol dehydrogenases) [Fimbriimonadaceae bacterium]